MITLADSLTEDSFPFPVLLLLGFRFLDAGVSFSFSPSSFSVMVDVLVVVYPKNRNKLGDYYVPLVFPLSAFFLEKCHF